MKITYIIMPFENCEYLVRCINSMYRQPGTDYEVILAENFHDRGMEELNVYLDEMKEVRRISDSAVSFDDKLDSAMELVSADSGYVMFVDVDTVISPIAAKAVLACEQSDLIIPAAYEKRGFEFRLNRTDMDELLRDMEKYPPQRYCFGKKVFSYIKSEFFYDRNKFSAFIFSIITGSGKVSFTDDVCIYIDDCSYEMDAKKEFAHTKEGLDETLKELQSGLAALQRDIAALSINQHLMFARLSTPQNSTFNDPVVLVPRLYAEGKLGLKTIMRSLWCWVIYKLSKKMEKGNA